MKKVTISFSEPCLERVDAFAAQHDISRSDAVQSLIDGYFSLLHMMAKAAHEVEQFRHNMKHEQHLDELWDSLEREGVKGNA